MTTRITQLLIIKSQTQKNYYDTINQYLSLQQYQNKFKVHDRESDSLMLANIYYESLNNTT